ncbi:ankyrin repeat protein [Thozetella sp. PMI_491]|nr:ankyrin repeat protein [Thozetella sp. PMI_491]
MFGGSNPFHYFCQTHLFLAATALLRLGVEINIQDDRRFGLALCRNTPLHEAAREGNSAAVRILLSSGADANACSLDGNIPLHLAVQKGHIRRLRSLSL